MLKGCGPAGRAARRDAPGKRKDSTVSLVSSPTLSPAPLAAKCANALESTGQCTTAGKRRIMLNALKHRRYSRAFGENLVKAGADAELFDWIRSRIFDGFQPLGVPERWQAEELARKVWCRACRAPRAPGAHGVRLHAGFERLAGMSRASVWCLAWTPWRRGGLETKPRYSLESADSFITSPLRILRSYAQLAATIPPMLDREFVERQNAHGEPSTPRRGARAPLATDMQCPLARQEV